MIAIKTEVYKYHPFDSLQIILSVATDSALKRTCKYELPGTRERRRPVSVETGFHLRKSVRERGHRREPTVPSA